MPENFTNGFISPVFGYSLLTDHNEYIVNPWLGLSDYHVGEDWYGEPLGPVQAIGNGTVVFAGYSPEFGANLVVIEHTMPDGTRVTSYSGNLDTVDVAVGDQIVLGQDIGTIYTTGSSGGLFDAYHLHFALYVGDNAPAFPPDYVATADVTPTTGFVDPSDFIASNPPTGVLPDLAISDLQVNDDIWHEADFIQVTWTTENDTIVQTGAYTAQIYLSLDATITTDDILISAHDEASILSLQTVSNSSDWTMISPESIGMPEGTYYIGVIVDPYNLIEESDETNNVSNVVEVTLSNSIVNFTGTNGNDYIIGTEDNNYIEGLYGNDIILGHGGDDTIMSYDGLNYLFGNEGDDEIYGGTGIDYISGGAGDDIMTGWMGNDRVMGGNGDDLVMGYDGHDLLFGQDGDDVLNGHYGHDILSGGAGNDIMQGGGGFNTFIFDDGMDIILDFYDGDSTSEGDTLALDAVALGIVGLTAQEVVTQYGGTYNDQAVLNFGNGDVLFFVEIEEVTDLTDHIVFI